MKSFSIQKFVGTLPTITVKFGEVRHEHHHSETRKGWEGYGGSRGQFQWSTEERLAALQIETSDPFLMGPGAVQDGWRGMTRSFPLPKGLDRSALETSFAKMIAELVKAWGLPKEDPSVQEQSKKILSHLMAQVPDFVEEQDLVVVDEEKIRGDYLQKIPHGIFVEVLGEFKPNAFCEMGPRTTSRVRKVVRAEVARQLEITGSPLAGPATICWVNLPEGEIIPLRQEASQLLAEVEKLRGAAHFSAFPKDLREKVEDFFSWCRHDGNAEKAREFCRSAKALLAEFKKVEGEAKALHARTVTGEILLRLEASHRYDSVRVFGPDGTRRPWDECTSARHKMNGQIIWERIEPNELAVISGSGGVKIAHLPVGGPTEAQKNAVAQFETELGLPKGRFGFDDEATALYNRRFAAVEEATKKITGQSTPEEADYFQVISDSGVGLYDEDLVSRFARRVNWATKPDSWIANRDAYCIAHSVCADGMLEFFVYDKFGGRNLSMRWRELTEEEKSSTVTVTKPAQTTGAEEASASAPAKIQWENLGKGWWRCSQGHTAKSKVGEPTACTHCR